MAPPAPDGGFWAYTAVLGCFMGNVIGDGVMYSFGIFLPMLKKIYNCGSAEMATVNAIQMGVTFASGPIASWMTNILGWRLTTVIGSIIAALGLLLSAHAPNVFFLYFSAGGLIGLGLGVIYLPRLDCITQYFDKKRPFVTGIAICGSGIGTFIFAPFTSWLLEAGMEGEEGGEEVTLVPGLGDNSTLEELAAVEGERATVQHALYIIAAICLTNCVFGLLFKPLDNQQEEEETREAMLKKSKKEEEERKDTKSTFWEMVYLQKNWVFMMFAISNFFTSLGYPIPYTFVPDNAKVLGLTPGQGAFIVSIIGITNTIARILLGIVSLKLDRLFLYNTCLVICGLSMVAANYFQPMLALLAGESCPSLLTNSTLEASTTLATVAMDTSNSTIELSWACDQYTGQMIYAVLYGVTSAAYVLLTTLVLADLLGAEAFTNAFGLLLLYQGVATFLGPPIVGAMFDSFASYNPGFLVMGLMIALSGAMLYPIPWIKRCLETPGQRLMKRGLELEPL